MFFSVRFYAGSFLCVFLIVLFFFFLEVFGGFSGSFDLTASMVSFASEQVFSGFALLDLVACGSDGLVLGQFEHQKRRLQRIVNGQSKDS